MPCSLCSYGDIEGTLGATGSFRKGPRPAEALERGGTLEVVPDDVEAVWDNSSAQEAAAEDHRARVWVLIGGDGPERHLALAEGANVVAKLSRFKDLLVSVADKCVVGDAV
jgi:hypothetical protein